MEKLWKQYQRMVQKQAWYCAKKFSLEYEDMFEAGVYWFVQAYKTFDSNKASFSTHLFSKLRGIQDAAVQAVRRKKNERQLSALPEHLQPVVEEVEDIAETFYATLHQYFSEEIIEIIQNAHSAYHLRKTFVKIYGKIEAQKQYAFIQEMWKQYRGESL